MHAGAVEPIKVGYIVSLTGPSGFFGSHARDAFTVMIDDINGRGGVLGRPIVALIEDDRSVSTNAVVAVTKLIKDSKVAAVIGPTIPDCGMAMIPVVEREKTPLILTAPVAPIFRKWVFSVGPGDIKAASRTLEVAVKDLEAKRIALMCDAAVMGQTGANIIKRDLKLYPDVTIVAEERYETTDTNMVPQLTKLRAANPDLIILYGGGPAPGVVAKNYKQLGMTTRVLGTTALANPDFMSLGGRIAEECGWVFTAWKGTVVDSLPSTDPYRANLYDPFKKIFQKKYGKDKNINVFHLNPPDAINYFVAALKMAGTDDRAALRDALEKVRIEGLLGMIAPGPTDHYEGAKDTSVPAVLKNGKFVPYATSSQ
jgi:branched-chain amino acid transport system substrate-binding protein